MGVYEEARRHQLVTEFNIQPQAELNDYQVQLADVGNPTQAQDNFIVGPDGVPMSHWNESIDFDTWIKIDIEASGKRGLLIHGNSGLNSESNGNNVFPYLFDDFATDQLGSYWSGDTGSFSVSGGELSHTGGASWHYLNRNINVPSSYDWCLCSRIKTDSISDDRVLLGLSTHALLTTDDSVAGYLNGDGSIKWYKYVNTVYTELLSPQVATADVYHTQEISKVSTSFEFIVDTGSLDTETIAEYDTNYMVIQAIGYGYCDYIFVRKHSTVEPITQIGTPKNISTILKSLGRAG